MTIWGPVIEMIELEKITIQNFGPFQDEQSIDFGGKRGVFVVHGNNGHGKTSLLNAFRWAFTGKARDLTGPLNNHDLINDEAVSASGDAPAVMRVTVTFSVEGTDYEVQRTLTREPTGKISPSLSLVQDGNVLGTKDSEARLREILPPEIQQFFFFDGELIKEFENLLTAKSHAAVQLKDSIETVLGIPVLRGASDSLSSLCSETAKSLGKRSDTKKKNKDIYKELERHQKEAEKLRSSVKASKESVKTAAGEILSLEKRMQETETTRTLISERDVEKGKIEGLEQQTVGALSDLQVNASDAWKAPLATRLGGQIEALKERAAEISKTLEQVRREGVIADLRGELGTTGICPVCEKQHEKSPEVGEKTKQGSDVDDLSREQSRIRHQMTVLQNLGIEPLRTRLQNAISTDFAARNNLATSKNNLKEIQQKLGDVKETDVLEVSQSYANKMRIREAAELTQKKSESRLEEVKSLIKSLQDKLKDDDDTGASRLNEKLRILGHLRDFFDDASDKYREDQKGRVEEAATKLFVSISHQEEYERLRITETYGLEIVHRDGKVIRRRSAGYEHIVAVSLVGALQETSTVKGPVVMDSPFGKLDKKHGDRVIALLPKLAPQVLLLAQDRETTPKEVARALEASDLVAQRELVHVSARETRIEHIKTGP